MKNTLLLTACMSLSTWAFADGLITGRVTDEKTSEPLIGVVVSVKGSSVGTATDLDGNYTLKVPSGTYEIEIKYLGYTTKSIGDVALADDQNLTLNATLAEQKRSRDLGEVVVRATLKKENINSMILVQKNTNTVAQVVSAEAIRRSPDRNTGEVLKRVSGASIQEGKYLVVRGLADRYNAATLNGALLTSTEPDRKTFSFDLFPANIIDNIVINKAAVPELPGEFAGGLVQINTRDIPTENFFTLQLGTGANTQTVGKPFQSNNTGGTDFLGIDNGSRALPGNFPASREAYLGANATEKAEFSKQFANNWGLKESTAPINFGTQGTGGYTRKIGRGTFGFIGSFNYAKNNRRTDILRRDEDAANNLLSNYNDQRFSQDVSWGGLANLAYTVGKSKISLKNLININSTNSVTTREGEEYGNGLFNIRAYELAFVTNRIFSSQLAGEHVLDFLSGLRAKWNLSYSNLAQNTPDLRRLSYQNSAIGASDYVANIPQGSPSLGSSGRFFSDLMDHVYSGSGDLSKSFKIEGVTQTIKVGGMYQYRTRDFTPRALGYVGNRSNPEVRDMIVYQPIGTLFNPENIAADKLYLNESTNPTDKYQASSALGAGYIQLDNQFLKRVSVSWGARIESYNQQVKYNDGNADLKVDTTVVDILPSANIKYALNDQMNLRLSGSQTVIRPEFREIAPFNFYNFDLMAVESGNPTLKRTKVTNADLRWELYPAPGEFVTVGGFYKHFDNPIERYYNTTGGGSAQLLYANALGAVSYGVEAEFRKSLGFLVAESKRTENNVLSNLYAFANGAYIKNEVDFGANSTLKTRPMQGQSNYVLNAGVQAEIRKTGTIASVMLNRIGRRIFLIGDQVNQLDIWEAPRTLLDLQITQRFAQNGEIKLAVSDLLNQYQNFYEDTNGNGKYDGEGTTDVLRIRSRYGRNISISVAYKLPNKRKRPAQGVTIP
ncbi:MAG: TonB-dependent receptor [Sphingobacteriales bacterium]|nr:MAG: TonB-dependent receptor [Sphingobacteriales bacterium]